MVTRVTSINANTTTVSNDKSQTKITSTSDNQPLLELKTPKIEPFQITHEETEQTSSEQDDDDTIQEEILTDENSIQNPTSIKNESYTDAQQLSRKNHIMLDRNQTTVLNKFVDAMEDEDESKIDDFLVQKYPQGLYFTGNANAFYENGDIEGSSASVNADAMLTYTNKNNSTLVAGGSVEYKSNNVADVKTSEKNGNVVLGYKCYLVKPENGDVTKSKYTFAALTNGNFNDGIKQFNGSVGLEHNPTGLAANYRVQAVMLDGQTTFKKNFAFTFLDNDKSDEVCAGKQSQNADNDENPNAESSKKSASLLKNPKTKFGKYLVENKAAGYGLGVKFVLQNADLTPDDEIIEYGPVANYSFSVLNNKEKFGSKNFVVTPSIGVLESGNQIKITDGVEADYKSTFTNGTKLSLNTSVKSNTAFATKEEPACTTVTTSFTGRVDAEKISAYVDAEYIKNNHDMKSTTVSANAEYKINDHITGTAQVGFTKYKLSPDLQNRCIQAGLGVQINF